MTHDSTIAPAAKAEQSASSQCAMILAHLRSGKRITGLEALLLYGCIHLPRRILDLKERGHRIEREMIVTDSGKRVAEYRMGARA